MDIHYILAAHVVAYLTDSLKERGGLDIADSAADLGDNYVSSLGAAVRNAVDTVLDLVGDVGNNLNGAAEIVAAALLVEDGPVDLTGCDVAVHGQILVDEALVVSEVEVGFGTVVGDEYLAVLVGAHCARVNVYIRVELLDSYLVPSHFKQTSE